MPHTPYHRAGYPEGRQGPDEHGYFDPSVWQYLTSSNPLQLRGTGNRQMTQDDIALALIMASEARGTNPLSQAYVGQTALNRVRSDQYPDNMVDVLNQPKQFSFMNTQNGQFADQNSRYRQYVVNPDGSFKIDPSNPQAGIPANMQDDWGQFLRMAYRLGRLPEGTGLPENVLNFYSPQSMAEPGSAPYWADSMQHLETPGVDPDSFQFFMDPRAGQASPQLAQQQVPFDTFQDLPNLPGDYAAANSTYVEPQGLTDLMRQSAIQEAPTLPQPTVQPDYEGSSQYQPQVNPQASLQEQVSQQPVDIGKFMSYNGRRGNPQAFPQTEELAQMMMLFSGGQLHKPVDNFFE